jgi:2,3-bisphosphoglycerate-independent phosphoglycerate mutase
MKCVVLVADGMADDPVAALAGKTPLECARTPHLDHMAARGILGLTRTIPRGLPTTSDVGVLAILGYDPARYRTGPAPLEAASLGVELGRGDVAFRCNLVTLETAEGGVEVMRDFAAGHPPTAEERELVGDFARALGREGLELHAGQSYRHLLVWRQGETGMRTVPPYDVTDKPVAGALPTGPGADVLTGLMARSREFFASHPLCLARRARGERVPTALWPWGAGHHCPLPTLRERFGVGGAVVAAVDLVNGAGLLAGLRRVTVPGATGFLDTDFRAKAEYGLRALDAGDFLLLHVEAPDEAGHMGDTQRKIEAIERFDEDVVGTVLAALRQTGGEWRMLVVPGHATACALRTHTAEPVPFTVYVASDEAKPRSVARGYSEREARDQGIFISEAHTLMERLLRP